MLAVIVKSGSHEPKTPGIEMPICFLNSAFQGCSLIQAFKHLYIYHSFNIHLLTTYYTSTVVLPEMQWSKKQKNIFDPSPQRIHCLGGKKNIYAGSITM